MKISFSRIISPSLSPNTEPDDVALAAKLLFMPWLWKKGDAGSMVEQWFRQYYPGFEVSVFNSGRSALLAILKAFHIGRGDDVLVQAFTCVAVPNSVRWAGARPVYVDIDDTLNIDPSDADKKLTSKTKAIIVQHTFGSPAQMEKLTSFAREHNLILIEDCAHSLGAIYKSENVGSFGDAAFFSFGRDKVISSVFGGAATISSRHKNQILNLKSYAESLPYPTYFWIFQQLFHPVAFSLIIPSYNILIGKILLVLLQKIRLLTFPVLREEKLGERPKEFPARYPNALAVLIVNQLAKIKRYTGQRREIVQYYENSLKENSSVTILPGVSGSANLRYPIMVNNPQQVLAHAKDEGILLGNWYHNVIDPIGTDFIKIGFLRASCPKAVTVSGQILNLPTRITVVEAQKVVQFLKRTV